MIARAHLIDLLFVIAPQSLLLDMNPRFDEARLTAADAIDIDGDSAGDGGVSDAITLLNGQVAALGAGNTFGFAGGRLTLHLDADIVILTGPSTSMVLAAGDYSGASALMLWVDFANFSVMTTPQVPGIDLTPDIRAAVGDEVADSDWSPSGAPPEPLPLAGVDEHRLRLERGERPGAPVQVRLDDRVTSGGEALCHPRHRWPEPAGVHVGDDQGPRAVGGRFGQDQPPVGGSVRGQDLDPCLGHRSSTPGRGNALPPQGAPC